MSCGSTLGRLVCSSQSTSKPPDDLTFVGVIIMLKPRQQRILQRWGDRRREQRYNEATALSLSQTHTPHDFVSVPIGTSSVHWPRIMKGTRSCQYHISRTAHQRRPGSYIYAPIQSPIINSNPHYITVCDEQVRVQRSLIEPSYNGEDSDETGNDIRIITQTLRPRHNNLWQLEAGINIRMVAKRVGVHPPSRTHVG